MENLDKLTATGLPIFDLNSENLDRSDWSQTPLGPRESWPLALQVVVNTCLLPVPHASAIFWGSELAILHNLPWGKACGNLDGQGARATSSYSGEALSALKACIRGRTVKVACRFFLKNTDNLDPNATILLSTVLDEKGSRQGVLAQLQPHAAVEKYGQIAGIDNLMRHHDATRTKDSQAQQPAHKGKGQKEEQVDSAQTQLFQRFAELLPNGLAILDSKAEAVFVNDGFFKLTTNKSSKDFRAWPESIDPRDYDRVMSDYRKAFSSREELRVEFRCSNETATDTGEWRLFLLRPLNDESEAGFICAVVDITEIKHAQLTQEKAAIEAQERKEQQERFIDMVSHEIRNPLSAVLHLAEEIKEVTGKVESEQSEYINDILDAADTILLCVSHQNTLVDDILSFSKLDSMMLSLVPRVVRPKWEFSKALKVFNSEFKAKNIKFHYAMDVSYDDRKIDYVMADLNRMKQVLVNLITNAIKFTAKKKGDRKIEVSMGASLERPTSYPPNVVFFSEAKEAFHIDSTMSSEWGNGSTMYLLVSVKDTGIGITAEDQAKLFERFRQATPKTQENYGGSGLGLFISRKLCQLHGGDIGVSSKANEGSTFGFFFKVRLTDGSLGDGRPPFASRNPSETSNLRANSRTPRPSSHSRPRMQDVKEHSDENPKRRPTPHSLTSYEGVDPDEVDKEKVNNSLENPPTEYCAEAHPDSYQDERFNETQKVAEKIETKRPGMNTSIEGKIDNLKEGETPRQADAAERMSKLRISDETPRPTLLLVEDNLINQKVLRRQLQSRGFEVFVANNGQEAVDAVEERGRQSDEDPDRPNYFDCILMDQEMPIKDGNAATAEIRELQERGKAGRSPILGVSANVREAQTQAMKEAGMDMIISKPFKVEDLVKKIKRLLPNR